ncbi:MAG: hypothetical protein P8179_07720 [Candidatus Thiodiazotropha sp.]
MTIIEACSGQETRRNAQGMARPFQALQRSIWPEQASLRARR